MRTCRTCSRELAPKNFYKRQSECKECCKKRRYRNRWKKWTGLDYDEIEAIRKKQKKVCACCGQKTSRLHVDHDHQTGKLRGLICASCNKGLGKLGDNIDGIKKALAYLLRAEEK